MIVLDPSAVTSLVQPVVLMHIPDGFLALSVAIACWLVAAAIDSLAVRRAQRELGERQVPLMGVMAAFIFAAQMINFPVAGGTSGHLLGGTLAAIALGPWPAMLVMTSVIVVQGLLFQDGGLVVMGANILNMGLVSVLVGYGLYRAASGGPSRLRIGVAAVAAWLSVVSVALLVAIELWLSGTARLEVVVPAMLGVHALIGIGEALITVAALAFIWRTRPDVMHEGEARGGRGWILAGVLLTLGVLVLAPFASVDPDGLERVAKDLGFSGLGTQAPYALFPDYTIPLVGGTPLGTVVAGAIGVLVVAAAVFGLSQVLRRSRKDGRGVRRPAA